VISVVQSGHNNCFQHNSAEMKHRCATIAPHKQAISSPGVATIVTGFPGLPELSWTFPLPISIGALRVALNVCSGRGELQVVPDACGIGTAGEIDDVPWVSRMMSCQWRVSNSSIGRLPPGRT
jgi:hypothetical protein